DAFLHLHLGRHRAVGQGDQQVLVEINRWRRAVADEVRVVERRGMVDRRHDALHLTPTGQREHTVRLARVEDRLEALTKDLNAEYAVRRNVHPGVAERGDEDDRERSLVPACGEDEIPGLGAGATVSDEPGR